MSEIKTILFDMDGTLYQDFNFHRDSYGVFSRLYRR